MDPESEATVAEASHVSGSASSPDDGQPTDGRVALRLRNRQKVIDALIELVESGEVSPTLIQVIERSGMSERSIFRYFDDLGDLSMEAIRQATTAAAPLGHIDDLGEGDLDHRIAALVAARLRVAARVHPFGRLARQRVPFVPEIADGLVVVVGALRDQVAAQFDPELSQMGRAEAKGVIDVIVTILSFEGHDVLWRQMDNSERVVARLWTRSLLALLATPD